VLPAGVTLVVLAIAANSVADMAAWQPGPARIERTIVSDLVPAQRIALRYWPESQHDARAPAAAPVAPGPLELSDRELTFKHGSARRLTALRQMAGSAPWGPANGATARLEPQDAVRADAGPPPSRAAAKRHEPRGAPPAANRPMRDQLMGVAAPAMISLRSLSGLY
jgi:hypothetical protein